MTSQKSSKNNVNAKDFLRSLKGSIAFPAIALVVLFLDFTLPVLQLFLSREFQQEAVHDTVHVFMTEGSMFFYESMFMTAGMAICGMMTALKSLGFVMSKKQTNVYLSLGMKRMTLVLNRIIAGAICLFVSVLVPLTLTYLLNIAYLGYTAHLTSVYLYFVAALTVSALAGLAIGTVSASIAGNYFEGALNATAMSIIPLFAVFIFTSMKSVFLKGFVTNYNESNLIARLVTPFSFCVDLNAKATTDMYVSYYDSVDMVRAPLRSLGMALNRGDAAPDKFKVPEELMIDMGLILPIIIWALVSVALIVLGVFLFKRRRMEHAGSMGHFKISTGLISTAVFTFITYVAFENMPNPDYFYTGYELDKITNKVWFILLLWLVITFVAYFAAQLILKRKFKAALKSLAFYPVLIGVSVIALTAVNTELFGTYNRLPETGEIKSAAVSVDDFMFSAYYSYDGEPKVTANSQKDIEEILKIFELVRNDKKTEECVVDRVSFSITEKDGDVIQRQFDIYSEKTYLEYMRSVYDSEYFDSLLRYWLIDDREKPEESDTPTGMMDGEYIYTSDSDTDNMSYKEVIWNFYDGTYLAERDDDEVIQSYAIDDSAALCRALYADLSTMTYDEIRRNTKKPLCALSISSNTVLSNDTLLSSARQKKWDYYNEWNEDYKEPVMKNVVKIGQNTIFVTPDMKNTIKYLEEKELLTKKTFTGEIKEILYTDTTLDYNEASGKFLKEFYNTEHLGGYYGGLSTRFTHNGYFEYSGNLDYTYGAMGEDKNATVEDFLKKSYVHANHPLISVTDKNKTAEIFNSSLPEFAPLSDQGRYVYVIYDNGAMMCLYMPEANLGVLK